MPKPSTATAVSSATATMRGTRSMLTCLMATVSSEKPALRNAVVTLQHDDVSPFRVGWQYVEASSGIHVIDLTVVPEHPALKAGGKAARCLGDWTGAPVYVHVCSEAEPGMFDLDVVSPPTVRQEEELLF